MNKLTRRSAVLLLCSVFAGTGIPVPAAHAAFIGTDSVLHGTVDGATTGVARQALVDRLVEHGVDAAFAGERVAALTDEQVNDLNGRFDQLPAGGDLLGIAAFLFIVLVITDALGVTDVFTFVKKPAN